MISSTLRRCLLIIVFLMLSACDFNSLVFNLSGEDANKPPGGGAKPSQTSVKVVASQVIEDEIFNLRGDSQLELDLTPPEGSTAPTFAVQATGDGTKQVSIAGFDRGKICWVNYSFKKTIMQLNGSVDAQTQALTFTLTETFEGKPTTTTDCGMLPPMDGTLLFTPSVEGPYRLSLENPVFKLSSEPNSWTEVRLEIEGE